MTDAWKQAEKSALALHAVRWSFHITDEDDAVFNVFAPRESWHLMRMMLGVTVPEYEGPEGQEFTVGSLTLAILTPEEHDGREPAGPDPDRG